MRAILITISLLAFSVVKAHPVYVSIFHINYDETGEELQISIRVFTDDLEAAIALNQEKPIILTDKNPDTTANRLTQFLNAQLSFSQQEENRAIALVGIEFEPDVCWIHCTVQGIKKESEVSLETKWLYNYQSSQSNIVYLKTPYDEANHILVQNDNQLSFSLLE